MKRFVIASALAIVGALGFAGNAEAQYVYGYQTFVPGGGTVIRNQTFSSPFGYQNSQSVYSPWTGGVQQSTYADVFGNRAATTNVYTPLANYGYGYTPNYYAPTRFYPNNLYPTNLPAFNDSGYYYRR